MTLHVKIAANGRLVLPAGLRRRLGLADGGELVVEETESGVLLRTVAQSVAQARDLARRYTANKPDASVDAFLTKRRSDSGE